MVHMDDKQGKKSVVAQSESPSPIPEGSMKQHLFHVERRYCQLERSYLVNLPALSLIPLDPRLTSEKVANEQLRDPWRKDLRIEGFDYSPTAPDYTRFAMAILSKQSQDIAFAAELFDMPDPFFLVSNLGHFYPELKVILLFVLSQHPLFEGKLGGHSGFIAREYALEVMNDNAEQIPPNVRALAYEMNIKSLSAYPKIGSSVELKEWCFRKLMELDTQKADALAPLIAADEEDLAKVRAEIKANGIRTPEVSMPALTQMCQSAAQAIYGSQPEEQLSALRSVGQPWSTDMGGMVRIVYAVCTNSLFPEVRLQALKLLTDVDTVLAREVARSMHQDPSDSVRLEAEKIASVK
jgi:hypothetical protein